MRGELDDWSAGQVVAPQRRSTFHANISAQEHPVNTRAAPLRSASQGEHAGMRFMCIATREAVEVAVQITASRIRLNVLAKPPSPYQGTLHTPIYVHIYPA